MVRLTIYIAFVPKNNESRKPLVGSTAPRQGVNEWLTRQGANEWLTSQTALIDGHFFFRKPTSGLCRANYIE